MFVTLYFAASCRGVSANYGKMLTKSTFGLENQVLNQKTIFAMARKRYMSIKRVPEIVFSGTYFHVATLQPKIFLARMKNCRTFAALTVEVILITVGATVTARTHSGHFLCPIAIRPERSPSVDFYPYVVVSIC